MRASLNPDPDPDLVGNITAHMPPPPPPGQPVREVRIELPVVASQSQGETFSDDDPCLEFGNDEPQSGIGDAKAWQDIE